MAGNYLIICLGGGHILSNEGSNLDDTIFAVDMFQASFNQGELLLFTGVGEMLSTHQPAANQQLQSRLMFISFKLLQALSVFWSFLFSCTSNQNQYNKAQQLPHHYLIIYTNISFKCRNRLSRRGSNSKHLSRTAISRKNRIAITMTSRL